MAGSRTFLATIIALAIGLSVSQGWAAERKKWETLTDCQYVDHSGNDGDSFRVRCGTKDFSLRLYFVDAPEMNFIDPERTRQQSDYFGVTLDQTLKGGKDARDLVSKTLREPFTVWTRWASAAGRSNQRRYFAVVLVGTDQLDNILIRNGMARPKGMRANLPTGEKGAAHVETLRALEDEARTKKAGLWAHSTGKRSDTSRP